MDEFRTTAKLWPTGVDLDLGIDSNTVTVPAGFTRHAANFVTSMDGAQTYQFLFWNTARHLTNKRHVRWNFSAGGWGLWTAVRWYGTPSSGPGGPARVHAEAFTIGGNAPLGPDTPIDGAASTYPANAFPFVGNDHEIGTATGPVDVAAKDPFAVLQFAGWLRLIWGGDDSGEFVETDTGGAPNSPTFFAQSSERLHLSAGESADVLATYGNGIPLSLRGEWERVFSRDLYPYNFDWEKFKVPEVPIGDWSPDDMIRLAVLAPLLRASRPAALSESHFQRLIGEAAKMTAEELKRAKVSLQTSLDLGQTALSTIEAHLKQRGRD